MWSHYRQDLARIRPAAWTFLAGSALMGAAHAVPFTLLQLYLSRLGYAEPEIGAVLSAEAVGQLVIAIPGAILLARRRTPPLLVLSGVVTACGFAVLPWLGSLAALYACKLIVGFAWYLHYVAIAPFLHRHSSRHERSTLFGLADAVHTAAAVGACLASGKLVALLGASGGSTRALALVLSWSGLLPLLAAFVYARIGEDRPELTERRSMLPVLRAHRGLLARFVAPQWLVALGAGLTVSFFGLYFEARFERTPEDVSYLYAAWQGLATVGFLLTPVLVRRMSFVWSMVLLELGSIPFFLTLAFTQSYPLAVVSLIARGALMNSAAPILKTLMMEASPAGVREVQVALNATAWGAAWVVGPWLGGWIIAWSDGGYAPLMCTTVVLYVAASLTTLFLLGPLDPRGPRRHGVVEGPATGS